jgi:regulator of sirC expression with transglutaminase-like and TPR domain
MIEDKELKALISLLEDPSDDIFKVVNDKLKSMGTPIIPQLEYAWENTLSQFYQERIENLIQDIQFSELSTELKNWNDKNSQNLLLGTFLVAKYKYPTLDFDTVRKQVDALIADVLEIYDERFTPLEKVKAINHIIFDVHRFSRNDTQFYAINNSYLNKVLETKKGNSLTLAIVYLLIAQALNLPIYGVNLPKNFILAFMDERCDNERFKDDVLFYINPFNRGAVLGKREIDHFLIHQQMPSKLEYYSPCKVTVIIHRLFLSLIFSYDQKGLKSDVKAIGQLVDILKKQQ